MYIAGERFVMKFTKFLNNIVDNIVIIHQSTVII